MPGTFAGNPSNVVALVLISTAYWLCGHSAAAPLAKRPATRRIGTGATISERLEAVKAALAEEPKRVRSVEEMRGGSSSQDA